MNTHNNFVVDRTDDIACDKGGYTGRATVSITCQTGRLVIYFEPTMLRRLHRAVGDYLEGPDGSTDRRDIVPAEAATGCEGRERGF